MPYLAGSRLCQWLAAAAVCLTHCIQQTPTVASPTSSLSDETSTQSSAYNVLRITSALNGFWIQDFCLFISKKDENGGSVGSEEQRRAIH